MVKHFCVAYRWIVLSLPKIKGKLFLLGSTWSSVISYFWLSEIITQALGQIENRERFGMNKWYSIFTAMVLAIGVLAGCGAQQEEEETSTTEEEQAEELTVDVQISEGDEMIAEDEFKVEEGTTLMEVMESNYEVEQTEGFINSIEGIPTNEEEKMAWMYTINGEEVMVGANEYELEDGDEVLFNYQSWE